jgi:hypothetical protein
MGVVEIGRRGSLTANHREKAAASLQCVICIFT